MSSIICLLELAVNFDSGHIILFRFPYDKAVECVKKSRVVVYYGNNGNIELGTISSTIGVYTSADISNMQFALKDAYEVEFIHEAGYSSSFINRVILLNPQVELISSHPRHKYYYGKITQ